VSTLKTTVSASLGTPGVASASYNNTVASQPPEGFYVVIGRGAASAVNLATLLQSPAAAPRLAHPKEPAERLKIHLVGLPDPWETYHAHGMGQPPHLLCLPGFAKKPMPGARTIRSGMHSQDFSAITHEQMDAMIKQAKITTHTAWVPIIQPQLPGGGGAVIKPELLDKLEKEGLVVGSLKGLLALDYPVGFPAYRLVLVNPTGECSLLYAHKIDICTGVGRPQNEVALRTTDEALSRLWRPPYDWDDGTKNRVMVTGPRPCASPHAGSPPIASASSARAASGSTWSNAPRMSAAISTGIPTPCPATETEHPPHRCTARSTSRETTRCSRRPRASAIRAGP